MKYSLISVWVVKYFEILVLTSEIIFISYFDKWNSSFEEPGCPDEIVSCPDDLLRLRLSKKYFNHQNQN